MPSGAWRGMRHRRKALAAAMRDRAMTEHTWEQRLRSMLARDCREGGCPGAARGRGLMTMRRGSYTIRSSDPPGSPHGQRVRPTVAPPIRPRCGVRIAAYGSCIPDKRLTNADLEKVMDTTDEWIVQRTGVHKRRIVDRSKGESTHTLRPKALRRALADAKLAPTDLDFIIVATVTPEMTCPGVASRVAEAIGAKHPGAMDLAAACSGFVYGTNLAHELIRGGSYSTVAVIGCDVLSSIMDYSTQGRGTAILFGDAGAGAILKATDDTSKGIVAQAMHSDGRGWKDLYVPYERADFPAGHEFLPSKIGVMQMNGRAVFKFAVGTFGNLIAETLEKAGLTADDVDHFVCHQSNAQDPGVSAQALRPAAREVVREHRPDREHVRRVGAAVLRRAAEVGADQGRPVGHARRLRGGADVGVEPVAVVNPAPLPLGMSTPLILLFRARATRPSAWARPGTRPRPSPARSSNGPIPCSAHLGVRLSEACLSGPAERLNQTDVPQPAIYVCSVASWRGLLAGWGLAENDAVLAGTAGLSLGEYTALHLAGSISFEEGLELVTLRGWAMQDAAEAVPSGMVALIGADEAQALAVCEAALSVGGGSEVLVAANFNAPGQVVLSGRERASERRSRPRTWG